MTAHTSRATTARAPSLLCVAAIALLAASCSDMNPIAECTAVQSISVVVTVRDSVTGSAAADNAIGTLVGDAVNDTLFNIDSLTIEGGNQLGTFTVTIDRPGYLTWVASNVHVTDRSECGSVIPVRLTALLQPETP
jgi:hypothetical protein